MQIKNHFPGGPPGLPKAASRAGSLPKVSPTPQVTALAGGGLGQMLAFHMGLFQMSETSSILLAMIALVVLVDSLSYFSRRFMSR